MFKTLEYLHLGLINEREKDLFDLMMVVADSCPKLNHLKLDL